jgi:hypothetical protein
MVMSCIRYCLAKNFGVVLRSTEVLNKGHITGPVSTPKPPLVRRDCTHSQKRLLTRKVTNAPSLLNKHLSQTLIYVLYTPQLTTMIRTIKTSYD